MTVAERDIASYLLYKLDGPDTDDMAKAVVSWMRQESGSTIVRNNPWNIADLVWDGFRMPKTTGFVLFSSVQQGIEGTAYILDYYTRHPDWRNYDKVVQALRAGNAIAFLDALAASAWDAARYGTLHGGPNHLRDVYDAFHPFTVVSESPGPVGTLTVPAPVPQPVPAPAPEPEPAPEPASTYTVQTGDSLWSIAAQVLGDGRLWPELWQANRATIVNPSVIHPGQVLVVPPSVVPIPQPETAHYTVKPGDTLSAIAQREYGDANDWPRIYTANRTVIGNDPDLIHPGQVFVIPPKG